MFLRTVVDVDTLVIGAGVIGLAAAHSLTRRGIEVMVLERHPVAGHETSTRNSGVIHAGIYYPRGSLKARLCIEGRRLLYDFCNDNGVPAVRCGKLLVAATAAETEKLESLRVNAAANGVDDLVMLSRDEARELEPDIECAAACLSPSTGVVDAAGLIAAIAGGVEAGGGQLVFNTTVIRLLSGEDHFEAAFQSAGERGRIRCRRLVIAAGHGAGALAAGPYEAVGRLPPATYPARGHYYRLRGPHRFRHLVYPIPEGAWLGTHLTLDTAGGARFGPDNEWVDGVDYRFDDSLERRDRFHRAVRRYWPAITPDRLLPDYVGVRPKIYPQGGRIADFAVHGAAEHGIDNMVALFGIESPGLTAGLAIGELVAQRLVGGKPE